MDKAQIAALYSGQVIYHKTAKNADGSALRARVSGQMREWKRKPDWFRPFTHGFRDHFYIGIPAPSGIKPEFSNPENWLEDDPT